MAGDLAVRLHAVAGPHILAADVQDEGVVDCVGDPGGEGADAEEGVILPYVVELRVAVEETGRDELVQDAHC